jgi:hypothetical protein
MDKKQLSELFSFAKKENIKMFFITRLPKEGMSQRSSFNERYFFKTYQIEIDEGLRSYLYEITERQVDKIMKNEELNISEYQIIDEESNHLYSYSIKNKVFSFSTVIEDLKKSPEKITDLENVLLSEKLWAYCLEFQIDSEKSFYVFRKVQPSKIGVEEGENKLDPSLSKRIGSSIRALFSNSTKKLSILEGATINIDKELDCIYYEEDFYVLKKATFETLLGLQEEYKKQADEIIDSFDKMGSFGDTAFLRCKIQNSPQLVKRIVKAKKIGNIDYFDSKKIEKLRKLSEKLNCFIKIENGKILLEDDQGVENVIKILCDYYKEGRFSGKTYGTYAGKIQKV